MGPMRLKSSSSARNRHETGKHRGNASEKFDSIKFKFHSNNNNNKNKNNDDDDDDDKMRKGFFNRLR